MRALRATGLRLMVLMSRRGLPLPKMLNPHLERCTPLKYGYCRFSLLAGVDKQRNTADYGYRYNGIVLLALLEALTAPLSSLL